MVKQQNDVFLLLTKLHPKIYQRCCRHKQRCSLMEKIPSKIVYRFKIFLMTILTRSKMPKNVDQWIDDKIFHTHCLVKLKTFFEENMIIKWWFYRHWLPFEFCRFVNSFRKIHLSTWLSLNHIIKPTEKHQGNLLWTSRSLFRSLVDYCFCYRFNYPWKASWENRFAVKCFYDDDESG